MYEEKKLLALCLLLLAGYGDFFRLTFYTDPKFSRPQLDSNSFFGILKGGKTVFVPTYRANSYVKKVHGENNLLEAVFLKSSDVDIEKYLGCTEAFVYLGHDSKGTDYVAIELTRLQERLQWPDPNSSIICDNLRNLGDNLNYDEAALLAYARGMVNFHLSNSFCSSCGSKTMSQKCGRSRKCTSATCRTSSYPRIEPAAIMLVTSNCQNFCVLGRKAAWPLGRYSTLAGFLEVGESLEQAFIRETREESGIEVLPDSVRYIASQPWPFPSSMMVGFRGRAGASVQSTDSVSAAGTGDFHPSLSLPQISFDSTEMEDVRWFSKSDVQAALKNRAGETPATTAVDALSNEQRSEAADPAPHLNFPGRSSLARLLIEEWCEET